MSLNPFDKNKKFCKSNTETILHEGTQKIFEVDGHVITGAGSLEVLRDIVETFKTTKCLPDKITRTYEYTPSCTEVVVCKVNKMTGLLTTVQYDLTPTNFRKVRNNLFGKVKCDIKVEKHINSGVDLGTAYNLQGSGSALACGSLHTGQDPIKAMEAAKKFDEFSGGATIVMDCVTLKKSIAANGEIYDL